MLRYLILLAFLLAPIGAFAQPDTEAPSPGYVLPPGYTLVPTSTLPAPQPAVVLEVPAPPQDNDGAAPWWLSLVRDANLWAIFLAMVFGIWRFFSAKSADAFQAAFREAVTIAYHATEEDAGLGKIGKSEKGNHFVGIFQKLLTQAGHKKRLVPAVFEAAKVAAKALNSPSAEAPADPT